LTAGGADQARRNRLFGWACGVALLVVWTTFHLVSRAVARELLTPWDLTALRATGGFVAVLPLLAWRGRPRLPPRRIAAVVALAGLGFPLGAYAGYAHAPTAHGAVLLAGCLPLVTALIAWGMGMAGIDLRKGVSLLGIVLGTAMLGLAGGAAAEAGAWRGDLCFIGATLCWGLFTVLAARWRLTAIDAALAFGLFVAPLYLPVWWLFLPSEIGHAGWHTILFNLVFQGVIAGVLNGVIYTQCVRTLGPGPTTMVGAMVPSLAAALAWPLLGEALAPLGIAGVLLVTLATVAGVGFAAGRRSAGA